MTTLETAWAEGFAAHAQWVRCALIHDDAEIPDNPYKASTVEPVPIRLSSAKGDES